MTTNEYESSANKIIKFPISRESANTDTKSRLNDSEYAANEHLSSTSNSNASPPFGDYRDSKRKAAMSSPSREEYDAKLSASEARIEVKLTAIEGKIDRLSDQIFSLNTFSNERMQNLSRDVGEARDAAKAAETSSSNIKWHILFTALGVVGLVFVMWQVWVQGIEMISGLFSQSTQ